MEYLTKYPNIALTVIIVSLSTSALTHAALITFQANEIAARAMDIYLAALAICVTLIATRKG